jgi:hypothetical protein
VASPTRLGQRNDRRDLLLSPSLIGEGLSSSTGGYYRADKPALPSVDWTLALADVTTRSNFHTT